MSYLISLVREKSGKIAVVPAGFVFVVHFLENVPIVLKSYSAEFYIKPSEAHLRFFEDKKGEVIPDLPSRLSMDYQNWDEKIFDKPVDFIYKRKGQAELIVKNGYEIFLNSHNDLFEYNREIIYMNWQTKHKQHIIGGAAFGWIKISFILK